MSLMSDVLTVSVRSWLRADFACAFILRKLVLSSSKRKVWNSVVEIEMSFQGLPRTLRFWFSLEVSSLKEEVPSVVYCSGLCSVSLDSGSSPFGSSTTGSNSSSKFTHDHCYASGATGEASNRLSCSGKREASDNPWLKSVSDSSKGKFGSILTTKIEIDWEVL